jgi:hypothetical protein
MPLFDKAYGYIRQFDDTAYHPQPATAVDPGAHHGDILRA